MKIALPVVALALVVIGAYFIFKPTGRLTKETPMEDFKKGTEQNEAIEKAKSVFEQTRTEGVDLRDGPCLAEELLPNWSFDIAHSPREAVDEAETNQCQNYRSGKTKHVVEFDVEGNLIRAL